MLPRLSIGIPTYNQAKYLPETIDSLLRQESRPFEIVVSNNHSTDNTQQILEGYGDQVRVVHPPTHIGMVENFQFAASQLSGDWISLLSSDDVACPNYVRVLSEGTQKTSDCVLVRAAFKTIDSDGNKTGEEWLRSAKSVVHPPETFWEQLLGPRVGFAAFAIDRQAFLKTGGFPKLNFLGDWAMWLQMAPWGSFVKQATIVTSYRKDYRASVGSARVRGIIEDEYKIDLEVIPRIAACMKLSDQRRLDNASRIRLQSMMAEASKYLDPIQDAKDRETVVSLLRSRASRLNSMDLMKKFERAEPIEYHPPWHRSKKTLRLCFNVFQKLLATMRSNSSN